MIIRLINILNLLVHIDCYEICLFQLLAPSQVLRILVIDGVESYNMFNMTVIRYVLDTYFRLSVNKFRKLITVVLMILSGTISQLMGESLHKTSHWDKCNYLVNR